MRGKRLVCREGGNDCDWEVRDSNEGEVIASAQDHARRRHGQHLTVEQLRRLVREWPHGVGGI